MRTRALFLALCLTTTCLGGAAASAAQEPTPRELRARIAAASQQEQALEAQLAQADAKTIKVAALFGESDEEKAARLQHEQNQDQGIANASQRINDLENSLRSLTGQVEQLDHRIDVLNQRIDRMQKDFDYKLCAMAQQQLGAGEGGLPCDQQTSQAAPSNVTPAPQNFTPSAAPATGAPAHLAPGPGTLGTLPAGTPLPQSHAESRSDLAPPPADAAATPPPASNPDYDKAMKLLARTQYDQAAAAFRSFADKNPDSPLAANALFWIGDIAYVQKNYDSAVHLLAEGIKKYPNATKTPDTFLKLGESLIANNQKKEGCTVFAMLPTKYPNAPKNTVAKAAADRKALCK